MAYEDIFFPFEKYDLILIFIGIAILFAISTPKITENKLITSPIIYLLLGTIFFFFLAEADFPHLVDEPFIGKRLTELGVILSLTSVGLKIKKPFSWKTWQYSYLLLLVTMPVTIAAVYFLGVWGLGFAPATAMLLGAVIAPTDPVLASDIQTTHPHEDDFSSARLALTTEAGLNDGLAFPFTNMAIVMAIAGSAPSIWFMDWLLIDFFYKIIGGTGIGILTGWLLSKIIFKLPNLKDYGSKLTMGLFTVCLTLIPYGVAEVFGTYGFIAVFVAACVFRNTEASIEYLDHVHDFSEDMEKIVVAIIFLLAGTYLCYHFTNDFKWYMIPAATVIIFVIRPISGMIVMWSTSLPTAKKYLISFYGIRGIGSMYYLLYAVYMADFEQGKEVLALVSVVIIISILVHGLSARYAIARWTPNIKT